MTRNRPIPSLTEPESDYVRALLAYEDEAILAFNKPSGLPTQVRGNRARNLDHLLWAFAKSNGKRPRLVHRLDAGTSGILLAGRTQPAAAALSEALASRTAEKTYLALVSGALPKDDHGRIDAPILRAEVDGRDEIRAGDPKGKPARTDWQVLARSGNAALLTLRPQTGRMHQLRVHLSHIGCPILGDDKYGGAPAGRLMLHAASIALAHPAHGDLVTLRAPVPEDFAAICSVHGLKAALAETDASV